MKKNKKLIKRIGCLIGAFLVALVSVCSIIPNRKQNIDYASADYISNTYYSNKIPVLCQFGTYSGINGYVGNNQNMLAEFVFNNTTNGLLFKLKVTSFDNTLTLETNFQELAVTDIDGGQDNWGASFWFTDADSSQSNSPAVRVGYLLESSFDVTSISSVKITKSSHTSGANMNNCIIYYYDASGKVFIFFFDNLEGTNSSWIRYDNQNPVIYPIVSPGSNTYQQGYSQGQSDGYNSGYNFGFAEGKIEGDSIGYNRGYGVGYNHAVADSSDYTFLGLMSAVVDAPIQALTGLLNFEILGVNLMDFITGLFTISIILFVVKLIL